MPVLSPWKLHLASWQECRRCDACHNRKNVVLARGRVPCDILFVGEAPGESEDVIGSPFVGPAGQLLDQIIERALLKLSSPNKPRLAFTNLVACIPKDDSNNKTTEPTVESIEACRDRLVEFIKLAKPSLIVAVGALSRDWLDQKLYPKHLDLQGIRLTDITHPAAILRANVAMQGLMISKCVITLSQAMEAYHVSA
jgi:DNA polymerase